MKTVLHKPYAGHFGRQKGRLGQCTRGKTAPGRLRRTDLFLSLYESLGDLPVAPSLTSDPTQICYMDLGYGAFPVTTLDTAAFFEHHRSLHFIGVEIDRERVMRAQELAGARVDFRLGGFNLPLQSSERVRILRAFNVLRQYDEADYLPAIQLLLQQVQPGALIFEGTSNPTGGAWTANIFRKLNNDSAYEALVLSYNLKARVSTSMFPPLLPKNLIHRMQAGTRIHTFFKDFERVFQLRIRGRAIPIRRQFGILAAGLAEAGYNVDPSPSFTKRGFLVWRNPGL